MTVQGWTMIECDVQVPDPLMGYESTCACNKTFGRMSQLIKHREDEHGIQQPRRSLSPEQIAKAVSCSGWQEFRIMLKGLPTERKLHHCYNYLQYGTHVECCSKATREIQVLNYLNALARGGLIAPLKSRITRDMPGCWNEIEVRR